jgi:hypothetical protein
MLNLLALLLLAAPVTNPGQISYKATSGTTRSLASKLGDFVSVKDFGATGDGTTDDTTAVAAAITAVTSSKGGVLVPCGTYKLTSALTIPTGVTLSGASMRCSILSFTGATSGLVLPQNASDFRISALTLTSSNASADKAIDMSAGNSSTGSSYGTWTIADVSILVSGSGRWAYGMYAAFAEVANVYNLRMYQSTTIGVYLSDSSNQLQFYNLEITGGGASDVTYNRGVWVDANPSGTGVPLFYGATVQGCFSLGSAVYVSGHHPKFYGLHAEGTCASADGGDFIVNGASDSSVIGGYIAQAVSVTGTVRGFLLDAMMSVGAVTFASTVNGAFITNSRVNSITDNGTVGAPTNNGNGWINCRNSSGTRYRNKGLVEFDAGGSGSATTANAVASAAASYPNGTSIGWRLADTTTNLAALQISGADQLIETYPATKQITWRNSTPTNKVVLNDTSLTLQAGVGLKCTDTNCGTITLSTGSGTATVITGSRCVCTDTTANASVKCAASGTTLTATGTGSDVIAYLCF